MTGTAALRPRPPAAPWWRAWLVQAAHDGALITLGGALVSVGVILGSTLPAP